MHLVGDALESLSREAAESRVEPGELRGECSTLTARPRRWSATFGQGALNEPGQMFELELVGDRA
tara:strand:+ start:663 stop:857 length:195 start_codon:yes stop_codon:yes gene_type:complete